jgi:ribonuclease P protein component
VLSTAHRVRTATDFSHTVRSGARSGCRNLVLYAVGTEAGAPSRFGFIVSKNVGNAVTRNLVKRRLREAAASALVQRPVGLDGPSKAGVRAKRSKKRLRLFGDWVGRALLSKPLGAPCWTNRQRLSASSSRADCVSARKFRTPRIVYPGIPVTPDNLEWTHPAPESERDACDERFCHATRAAYVDDGFVSGYHHC